MRAQENSLTVYGHSLQVVDDEVEALEKVYHKTVKKVTEDFEKLAFNTAISQMMIFVNAVYKEGRCPKNYAEGLIKMLSCICPHIGEEIWQQMGHTDTIAYEEWPAYDESKTADNTIEVAVQINGKIKAKISIPAEMEQAEVLKTAKSDENVIKACEGKNIVKEIYVKGRLVNIVVK